ncbi:MAG: helix-turn-helix domain-containing protein [Actinomadura sp.]
MPKTATRPGLATPAEAAEYLRRSRKTLRNWRSNGEGPTYVGRGHGVRYRWRDLDAWIDANSH